MRLRRPFTVRWGWDSLLALGLLAGPVVVAGLAGSAYWSNVFALVALLGVVALWNQVLLGQAGQVSFGQAAVMGAGAYGTAIAMTAFGLPYPVAFLGGVGTGLVVGALFAIPAQRVEGYYLGFVTLAAGVAFTPLIRRFPDLTGGISGIYAPVPELNQALIGQLSWRGIAIAVFAFVAVAAHARLRQSRSGRQMLMAKTSPEAVETLGVAPGRLRALAFILSGMVTGAAGALYVPIVGYVGYEAFSIDLSLLFFFAVIAGGTGHASGPVLGIWLLYIVPNVLLVDLVQYRLLAYGAIVFLIMLFIPDGIVGRIESIVGRRRRARAAYADLDVGGEVRRLLEKDRATEGART